MAIYNAAQLVSASNATYTTNGANQITAALVRGLNDDWISSSVLLNQANTFEGNQTINGDLTVTGSIFGTAQYASNTVTTGKNVSGNPIAKGTPLYFTGSGTSGNLVGILPADAGNAALMPAGGIAGEAIADGAEGIVLIDGYISGVNTSAFAAGDEVFVAVGGGYTNVAPTGSANLIQKLGNVEKADANGSGVINGPGATRSVPNIAQNNLWLGDANGVAQAVNQNTLAVKSAISSSLAYVQVSAANVDYHVTFNTINAGYKELLQETEGAQFTYNPSNNKLTVENIAATTLSGSLFGNATTATTASYALVAGTATTASHVTLADSASFVTEAVVAKTNQNNTFGGVQGFASLTANSVTTTGPLASTAAGVSATVTNGFGGYFEVVDSSQNNIGLGLATEAFGTSGWTGPALWLNNPSDTYPVVIGFENKSTWTDGRVTFLTPISASLGITGSLEGTASFALNSPSEFPYTGSAIITGSLTITGSAYGNVESLSIASSTASLDLTRGNFFTLQLVEGADTHINPSGIVAGQTVNLLLSTTGSATVSFPSSVKQVSGSAYVPTTTTSKDILTFVAFNSSDLYLANVKNLI